MPNNTIFENVCLNLKVLSQVMSNNKINISGDGDFTISYSTPFQPFFRFFTSDSRYKTIQYIRILTSNATEVSDNLMKSKYFHRTDTNDDYYISENEKNKHNLEVLLREMENSIQGINNLKSTYRNDIQIKSFLELTIDNLDTQIAVIKKKIK